MPIVADPSWNIAFGDFPKNGRFRAEGGWIRGWISSDDVSAVVDVRAAVGPGMYCGFCAVPGEGKAGSEDCPAIPSVGFAIFLQPPAGIHRLKLEFYDAVRECWLEGWAGEIEAEAPVRHPSHNLPVTPGADWMVLRTLRNWHARPRFSCRQHAAAVGVAGAMRTFEIQPGTPLYGCLEEPGERVVRTNHGLLSVNGWLAHATRAIVRVTAYVDPRMPARLEHGLPRDDVAQVFGHLRDAGRCHFGGEVVVPASHPEPWGLVVHAELDNGEQLLAFARRIWGPPFAADIPGELPAYSPLRYGAATAAVLGMRRWRDWPRAVKEGAMARKVFLNSATPFVSLKNIRYQVPAQRVVPPRRLSVVIVNDNFTLGGAALFAFEYACFLRERMGWAVRLVSPVDGPLRQRCEEAGIPTGLIDAARLAAAGDEAEFQSRVASLAATPDWADTDVVVANTMVVYWAVHLARALGKPSFFYIHESARIDALFSPVQAPLVAAALSGATRTVFVTEWTRARHRHLERGSNFRLLRSWTHIDRLDEFAATHDRRILRKKHGIPADAIVVVCLGSICDRKGQRMLMRAIGYWMRILAKKNHGLLPPQFLLVGARPGPDVDQLRRDIALHEIGGLVRLIDETPDALGFLRLADIYVCPSFEEGFPRALLEAAVMGLQIVTTKICGIPEMLRPRDAWFVPPGEPARLATALVQAMHAHRTGDLSRPRSARTRVECLFNALDVLPDHAALIAEAVVTAA